MAAIGKGEDYRGKNGRWQRPDGQSEDCEWAENEEPCWLCGRAGFSKIDDLEKIVNYLPTSLVRL